MLVSAFFFCWNNCFCWTEDQNSQHRALYKHNTSRQTAVKQSWANQWWRVIFMLVLFLLVSGQLWSAPRFLSGHTDRNNTKIKHRASSALPCFAALVWTRQKPLYLFKCPASGSKRYWMALLNGFLYNVPSPAK